GTEPRQPDFDLGWPLRDLRREQAHLPLLSEPRNRRLIALARRKRALIRPVIVRLVDTRALDRDANVGLCSHLVALHPGHELHPATRYRRLYPGCLPLPVDLNRQRDRLASVDSRDQQQVLAGARRKGERLAAGQHAPAIGRLARRTLAARLIRQPVDFGREPGGQRVLPPLVVMRGLALEI